MALIETWVDCYLGGLVKIQYIEGNVFSMDNMGNRIGVRVFDADGNPAELAGTVTAHVIRSDGNTVAVVGSRSENKCWIDLPQAAYYCSGSIVIAIKLANGSTISTLACVVSNVYQSVTGNTIDPGTIIPSIETLISSIETAVASIPADYSSLWASLAPAFSTSNNYRIGQYVTYNGGLYRFIAGHSAGSWNSDHVVAVNIGGELDDLKNSIPQQAPIIRDSITNAQIATVQDGAEAPLSALQIAIEPIQDLHGYANPYPGGASPQRWDELWESGSLSANGENVDNDTRIRSKNYIPVEPETSYYFKAPKTLGLRWYDSEKVCITSATITINNRATTSPEGAYYLRFTMIDSTTYENDISINYPSTDTSYHPWANICPITGWTGANVQKTGKNLFDKNDSDIALNKWINNTTGNLQNSSTGYDTSGYIRVKAETAYTASGFSNTDATEVCFFTKNKNFISGISSSNHTFATPENTYYLRFDYKHIDVDKTMLHEGTTASAYSAYTGNTYPVTWQDEAGTVYGGTLDPVNGVLKVDKQLVTFNGAESWNAHGTLANWFYVDNAYPNTVLIDAIKADTAISNTYKQYRYNDSANTPNGCFSYGVTGGTVRRLVVRDARFAEASELQTELETNNMTICFDLATPVTIQLDPVEIKTLTGTNNLWADCGNILLMEYGCDTKLYIDKKLAELIALIQNG